MPQAKLLINCWLFSIAMGYSLSAPSQLPHTLWFHPLTAKEGLSQSYNWYVYRDSEGLIWISSLAGLFSFDGTNVREYSAKRDDSTSLVGETIYSNFFEDSRKDIWFCTPEAIHCYQRKYNNFRPLVMYDASPAHNKINRDYQVYYLEKDSFLWFGAESKIYRFNIHVPDSSAEKICDFRRFQCRTDTNSAGAVHRLFGYGFHNGLDVFRFDKGGHSNPKKTTYFQDDLIQEVHPANDTLVWLITDKRGLVAWNPDNGTWTARGAFANRQSSLAFWGDRYLILASRGEGIFLIDKKANGNSGIYPVQCSFLNGDENALSNLKSIYLDQDDNLWISDEIQGLYFANLHKTKFRSRFKFPSKTGGINYSYWALEEDAQGRIWIATSPGGIFQLDAQGNLVQQFVHQAGNPHSLPSNWVRDILFDRKNNLWVATSGGVARFKNGIFQRIPVLGSNQGFIFNHLHQTSTGELLATAESGGIFEIKEVGGRQQLVKIHSSGNSAFQTIFEDKSGRLYCVRNASEICVFNFAPGKLGLVDSIPAGGLVNGFYEYKPGNQLFFATSNGLVKIDKSVSPFTLKIYTEEDGLPGKFIGSILPGNEHNLWLSTNRGIVLFDLKQDRFHAFSLADGMLSTEFHLAASMRRSNGELWFGGGNGITIINPKLQIKPVEIVAQALITDIKINDQHLDSLQCRQTGATNVSQIKHLVLPYSQNTVSFEFVAIDYSDPANNRIEYQLLGQDVQAVKVEKGNRGLARYPALPHGDYIFQVRAFNSDGEPGQWKQLKITIKPPWYLAWWFKTIAVFTFLGCVYAIYRFRIAQIRRKEALRRMEAEAKQQMAETETAILRLQMNPHFIFNSMNSINAYILKSDIDTASDYLGRFAHLMRMILNLAAQPFIAIEDEIEFLTQYLEAEKMRFEKKFEYAFKTDPSIDKAETIIPTMILQPFVENAIWHGLRSKKGKGKIQITFELQNETLLCAVQDNGVGRGKAQNHAKHESKALAITEHRLKLLEEESGSTAKYEIIDLKNAKGQPVGTKVCLYLPLL